jgi:hypothetical protein
MTFINNKQNSIIIFGGNMFELVFEYLFGLVIGFWQLFFSHYIAQQFATGTVIGFILGLLFVIMYGIYKYRQSARNVKSILAYLDKKVSHKPVIVISNNLAPEEVSEKITKLPFSYSRRALGLSREKNELLQSQGISVLNIATIKILTDLNIIQLHHVLARGGMSLELKYLIVITNSRFVGQVMHIPYIKKIVAEQKLHMHFLCGDTLPVNDLRVLFKIIPTTPPFPGYALYLHGENGSGGIHLKKILYPTGSTEIIRILKPQIL